MNNTNINTELPGNQLAATLPLTTPGAQQLTAIQTQAHEIEGRVGNVAVLTESIFDQLDAMHCHSPADHKLHDTITALANAVMESARAICTANESILAMTGGVQ
jgi:hypothetical protein